MNCPDCNAPPFPSEAILARHREFEHPEAVAAELEAAEKTAAEKKLAATEPENIYTVDGFLKAANRRTERPSLLPPQLSDAPGDARPPWEREALDIDS
jgi:hypothetical protein